MKHSFVLLGIRLFGSLALFLAFSYLFLSYNGVLAANLSQMRDILSTPKISTAANHTITFRSTSGVSSGSVIINFGNSISSVGSVDFSDVDLSYGGVEQTLAASPGANTWGVAVSGSGRRITLIYPTACTSPCAAIVEGATVTIKVGTNATSGDAQLVNGSSAGSQYISIVAGSDIGLFAVMLLTNPDVSVSGTASITQPSSGTAPVTPTPAPTPSPSPSPSPSPEPTTETAPSSTPTETTTPQSSESSSPSTTTTTTMESTPSGTPTETTQSKTTTTETTAQAQPSSGTTTTATPVPTQLAAPESVVIQPTQGAGGSSQSVIVGTTNVGGGGAQASVPPTAFVSKSGELVPIKIEIVPMSFDDSINWTGCSAIRKLKVVGSVAYGLTASNNAPKNAGDVAVEGSRPLQFSITYTEKDIEGQGFLEDTIHPFGFDPEDCMQTNIPFKLDIKTKTVTITVSPQTFFALTGDVQPGFVEKEIVVPQFEIHPIMSDIEDNDLGLDGGTLIDDQLLTGANETINLCLASKLFKKPVKRILLTVGSDKSQLQYDEKRDCFAGTIHAASNQGTQHVILKIIYIDDQIQILEFDVVVTSEFQENLLALAMPFLDQIKALNEQVEKAVQQSESILQTGAIAAVPVVGVANPALVTNALNWYYYLNHFFSWLMSLLGLRKKRKPWGTVYNSITKNVVDLVIVRLFDKHTNRLIETQVTDKAGRFSFLAPPGQYYITATKNPLVFPSGLIKGTVDGEYSHIYRQESFTVSGPDQAMTLSIPLDPPAVDRAVVAGKAGFVKRWKAFFGHNPLVPLLVGFIMSELLALYIPSTLNYTLLGLNGFFVLTQLFLGIRAEKSWGLVFDAHTLAPVPLAAITMFDAKGGKILRTRLSDYFGRFSFLTPPGEYMLAVMKDEYQFPAPKDMQIGKYHHLYFGESFAVKSKKAFIKTNIPVVHEISAAPEIPESSATVPVEEPVQTPPVSHEPEQERSTAVAENQSEASAPVVESVPLSQTMPGEHAQGPPEEVAQKTEEQI